MFRFFKLIDDVKFYYTGAFGHDSLNIDFAMHFNPCDSNYRTFILLHNHGYSVEWGLD